MTAAAVGCYAMQTPECRYYAAKFPRPNGRTAVWAADKGVTVYETFEAALDDIAPDTYLGIDALTDDYPPGYEPSTRQFVLDRKEDISGQSGTGICAVGIEFPDETCAMAWLTAVNSVAIYSTPSAVERIHSHGGSTQFVYTTEPVEHVGDGVWP